MTCQGLEDQYKLAVNDLLQVLVIDNEGYYPYMRPPLSKEIWFNNDVESTKKLKFKQWNGSERR